MTVTGAPRMLLRLEGAAVLAGAIVGYRALGGSWLLFALLFLTPDLSLLGYLGGARIGAALYNAAHTYLGPALVASLGLTTVGPGAWPIALIWAAHLGMDRAVGLGLKYPSAFRDTHLGTVGRAA
jgi:hypothetical protein